MSRTLDDFLAEAPVNKPGPHDVVFTQYLRPHGRKTQVWIERSPEVAALEKRVHAAGYHFDIEELMDRTVSMTVESNLPNDDEQAPIAIELCQNGPAVPEAVDRLIATAAERIGPGRS
jgi:hypothetical protein